MITKTNPMKPLAYVLGAIAGLALVMDSFTVVEAGEVVRIQNTITGSYEWHTQEGIKFKVPGFSRVDNYNAVTTIAVTNDPELLNTANAVREPLLVTFADNYGGHIEASWKVRLPVSSEKLEMIHQEVKSQRNLEGNTFLTFAKDMLNLTTDQFLAQDFMQGGKGAFKQRLTEQAAQGMYVTRRERVEVEDVTADQSLAGDRSQATKAKQYTYRVVVQTDEKTKQPLRRPHSLEKYGIEVSQVDLGEFTPQPDLVTYVDTIKKRERERADMIADQRKEREAAMTEQLRGETARITAKNQSLMAKDQEVINGQKQVELAQIQATREVVERTKVADLAKIDKQRELEIATANEGIQKANASAAKYEAQAIKEKGFAEAAVTEANYRAIDKEIMRLEVDKAKALALYNTNMKVVMPTIVGGGDNGGFNSLETMTSLKVLESLGSPAVTK